MDLPHPRFCVCCSAPVIPAPATVFNRPGLAEIAYRIGTFGSFRQAMLLKVHRQVELAGFLTRESDDHAVTVIELAAAMGDVLTFYNERISNEMYVAQARHKASLEQLIALLGYVPRPSLAAKGLLSFEIAEGAATRIWTGLKVMSVPGPDETAQIFETLEEIQATGRLNAAPLFGPPQIINALHENSARAPILGQTELAARDRLILFGQDVIEDKTVEAIEETPGGTYLSWTPPVQHPVFNPLSVQSMQALRRLRFFGHGAPLNEAHFVTATEDPTLEPQNRWQSRPIPGDFPDGTESYPLSAKIEDLDVGAHLLLDGGAGANPRLQTARVTRSFEAMATLTPSITETVTHINVRQTIVGRPTIAALPFAGFSAFARSGGHQPVWIDTTTTQQSLEAVPPNPVYASSDIVIANRGISFHLYFRTVDGELMKGVWTGAWLGWQSQGGTLTSAPVTLVLPGGDVRVFARDEDVGLQMFDTSGAVQAPQHLGGILASGPSVVNPGGNTIAAFARGIDNALWTRFFDGAVWRDWESLGGQISGTPAAVSTGPGRIDVLARARDGGLVHFRRVPGEGWLDIENLGGDPVGDPAAVAGGMDVVLAAVRNGDNQIETIWRSGDTWHPWEDIGGPVSSDPTLAWDFLFAVAARHADGTLMTRVLFPGADWQRHGNGFAEIPDRRNAVLTELGPAVHFREFDYPKTAEGGLLTVPLSDGEDIEDASGLGPLEKGRKVLIEGPNGIHTAEVTAKRAISAVPGTDADHLQVSFTPNLQKTRGQLKLKANISDASHGETQREEAIGSGDAAKPFQSFAVPPGEITHLPSESGVRPEPQVDLRVDGVAWDEVSSLYGKGPQDRVFTLKIPDEDPPTVRGGDGVAYGARFPTGPVNVRMTRRLGGGLGGNLQAGQLSVALEKPIGLTSVVNPFATSGGAPGEGTDDAREAAPKKVTTFGRLVSLQDFASLATASGLAAKAFVTWVWNRMERTAHLTVAGPGGFALSSDSLSMLRQQLTSSRDPNRPLFIANMVRVPIVVAAKVMRDPAYRAEDVAVAARLALEDAFAFDHRDIGQPVHVSDVFAILQEAAGVRAVDIDLLQIKHHQDLSAAERKVRSITTEPVQPHIRLYPARPTPPNPADIDRYQSDVFSPDLPPPVLPAEQAWFETPLSDIQLTIVEAL